MNKARELNMIMYCSLDFAKERLNKKLSQIESFAIIEHNRDTDKDGNIKQRHLHLFLRLKSSRIVNEIKAWFVQIDEKGLPTNVLASSTRGSALDSLLYLTHKNAPNKYQYDESLIYKYNIDVNSIDDIPVDDTFNILSDYLNKTPLLQMVKKYGKDFLYHYNCYKDIASDMRIYETSQIVSNTDMVYKGRSNIFAIQENFIDTETGEVKQNSEK